MKKKNVIVSLIFNAAILGTEGFALADTLFNFQPVAGDNTTAVQNFFCHYTVDSNLLLFVAALLSFAFGILSLIKKKEAPLWTAILKFIAVVSVATTFLVVVCFLVPTMGWENGKAMLIGEDFIFLHLIDPILALIVFLGFEIEPQIKKRLSFLCLVPLVIYTAVMAPICSLTSFPDPYGFLNLTKIEPLKVTGIWCAIFFGTWLVGFLLLWARQGIAKRESKKEEAAIEDASANQGAYREDRGPEATPTHELAADDVVVIQDDENSEESEEAQEIKDEEEAKKTNPTGYMNRPRVYHIAKQLNTGKWQVRLATGQKAIKLFDTQEQAINYAKSLVKTQGGSIRVHSLKGKMRKE
jgi:hypothetical protein